MFVKHMVVFLLVHHLAGRAAAIAQPYHMPDPCLQRRLPHGQELLPLIHRCHAADRPGTVVQQPVGHMRRHPVAGHPGYGGAPEVMQAPGRQGGRCSLPGLRRRLRADVSDQGIKLAYRGRCGPYADLSAAWPKSQGQGRPTVA